MSRKVYKLGQTVRVVVAGTDKLLRTVDFVLEIRQYNGMIVGANEIENRDQFCLQGKETENGRCLSFLRKVLS